MAITTAISNQAKQDLLDGVHAAGDTFMVALYGASATLDGTTTTYTPSGEVSGTGYTAGGQALTGRASSMSSGTGYISWNNPSWANSTISARGCMIYNATKSNKVLGVFDFGAVVSSTNGNFVVQLPVAGPATAIIRLS